MTRKSKKDRPPAIIQGVVADNVRRLRDVAYKTLPNTTARNKALAKDADTTPSQIQRVTAGELAAGIDLIERLAGALRVMPSELMTPYFAQKMDEQPTHSTPFKSQPTPANLPTQSRSSRS